MTSINNSAMKVSLGRRLHGKLAKLVARLNGIFALYLYLPFSSFSKRYRRWWRGVRGRNDTHQQKTRLAEAYWWKLLSSQPAYVVGLQKTNGNVHLSELAVLAKAAAATAGGSSIIEIGTFDGRTTLNLAVNSPTSKVFTLDLPPDVLTKFPVASGEEQFIVKPLSGVFYRGCDRPWSESLSHITQMYGDSAAFDWSPFISEASLVFVDGSHSYEYAVADTETALRLVAPGGIIIWHDYGVWEGVTQALEEIESAQALGLQRIRGTSLVFWRAPKG